MKNCENCGYNKSGNPKERECGLDNWLPIKTFTLEQKDCTNCLYNKNRVCLHPKRMTTGCITENYRNWEPYKLILSLTLEQIREVKDRICESNPNDCKYEIGCKYCPILVLMKEFEKVADEIPKTGRSLRGSEANFGSSR